jgi:hypothetical protein
MVTNVWRRSCVPFSWAKRACGGAVVEFCAMGSVIARRRGLAVK